VNIYFLQTSSIVFGKNFGIPVNYKPSANFLLMFIISFLTTFNRIVMRRINYKANKTHSDKTKSLCIQITFRISIRKFIILLHSFCTQMRRLNLDQTTTTSFQILSSSSFICHCSKCCIRR